MRRTHRRTHRRVALALALALLASGCGDGGDDERVADDPGPVHIHGLGIDPADGALYVATHSGLFRVDSAGGAAERVGDLMQDTMGFTVVGPNRFLGSGHPDLRERREQDLPPHLGLIESSDAGVTWQRRSLLGEADFHVLRAAGPRIFGYDSTHSRLLRSDDGGSTWRERPIPEPLFDLALHPDDPLRFVASGESGLYGSVDGGASWEMLDGPAALLSWPAAEALFLIRATGRIAASADGGRTWTSRGALPGDPAALLAVNARDLYVALHDGTIVRSQDGGTSFAVFSAPS